MSLADLGRKEIKIAENQMPGLTKLKEKDNPSQPLSGAPIAVNALQAAREVF